MRSHRVTVTSESSGEQQLIWTLINTDTFFMSHGTPWGVAVGLQSNTTTTVNAKYSQYSVYTCGKKKINWFFPPFFPESTLGTLLFWKRLLPRLAAPKQCLREMILYNCKCYFFKWHKPKGKKFELIKRRMHLDKLLKYGWKSTSEILPIINKCCCLWGRRWTHNLFSGHLKRTFQSLIYSLHTQLLMQRNPTLSGKALRWPIT